MNNEEGNNNYDIRNLIIQTINEQRNSIFLELCYVIYETTNKKTEAKNVLTILNEENTMRGLRKLEALTEENENKIYYYENDEYSPNKLNYQQELEKSIRTIRNEQLKKLAITLRELNEEEDIEI